MTTALATRESLARANDIAVRLYCQSGPNWTEAEIRGWWKDRLFIKPPHYGAHAETLTAELDRHELLTKRRAYHDGFTYFTPDGKEAEDAANRATLAAGQMREVKHIYTSSRERLRIMNMNKRWMFFDWAQLAGYAPGIEWVEASHPQDRAGYGLNGHNGASGYDSGCSFYSETGLKASERHIADLKRQREELTQTQGAPTFVNPDDAAVLGLALNANTPAKIMAAFRKLSKIHHPDMGGSASEFQRICDARDRALADLQRGGWRRGEL